MVIVFVVVMFVLVVVWVCSVSMVVFSFLCCCFGLLGVFYFCGVCCG